MENEDKTHRSFLQSTILATAGLALAPAAAQAQNLAGGPLTADPMHDHGLLRHALAIYQHAAFRLQQERLDKQAQAALSKALNAATK